MLREGDGGLDRSYVLHSASLRWSYSEYGNAAASERLKSEGAVCRSANLPTGYENRLNVCVVRMLQRNGRTRPHLVVHSSFECCSEQTFDHVAVEWVAFCETSATAALNLGVVYPTNERRAVYRCGIEWKIRWVACAAVR